MMNEMPPLEWYLERHGDTDDTRETYYLTYLKHTDYVTNKIAECTYLGTEVDEKYMRVLQKRAEDVYKRQGIGIPPNSYTRVPPPQAIYSLSLIHI